MTEDAKKKRLEYQRAYRAKNRERLNEYRKAWGKNNPDKVKQYTSNYWERKAAGATGATEGA